MPSEFQEEGEDEQVVRRVEVVPFGAGRDIGRSCVAVHFYLDDSTPASTVVFDCGLHVGHDDPAQAFPDFSQMNLPAVDCFLISHIHIDHCGALPWLTERHRYAGPIFMSAPTKQLLPRMLEDQLRNRGFTAREVQASVSKCLEMDHRREYQVTKAGLRVKMFRAGHVLGAVMFLVTFKGASVLYTGDYNATPDRHLGAYEQIGPERVDVLITESTYGTTTRGSALSQEREFLDLVSRSLTRGGKVLVPTYALGRVPEMISLLEAHWRRMNFNFKILLCTRQAAQVNQVYEEHSGWGPSREQPPPPPEDDQQHHASSSSSDSSSSSFVHARDITDAELQGNEPLVLIATSAMLAGGVALKAFRLWAAGEKNAVIFPGACVKGTLGHRLLGMPSIPGELDKQFGMVRCQVSIASFNAHTDCKGILQLVHQTRPREQIVLVHGVPIQMEALKRRMERELGPALTGKISFPDNLQVLSIDISNNKKTTKRTAAVAEVEVSSRKRLAAANYYASVEDFARVASFRVRERLAAEAVAVEERAVAGGLAFALGGEDVVVTLLYDVASREVSVVRSECVTSKTSAASTSAAVAAVRWIEQVAAEL